MNQDRFPGKARFNDVTRAAQAFTDACGKAIEAGYQVYVTFDQLDCDSIPELKIEMYWFVGKRATAAREKLS